MKPILVREQISLGSSISVNQNEYDYFYNPWHYHPELELTLIQQSFGQRHVGDSIENFEEGDLVLIGSNLPHVWKNDESYLKSDHKLVAQGTIIKFLPNFAGEGFMALPEMYKINRLIQELAPYGIKRLPV